MSRIGRAVAQAATLAPDLLVDAVIVGWANADAVEQAAFLGRLARALDSACERSAGRADRQFMAIAEEMDADARELVQALAAWLVAHDALDAEQRS